MQQHLSAFVTLLAVVFPLNAFAQDHIEISGRTKLSMNGAISLSIDEFEALAPRTIFKTSTPWHTTSLFSGISGVDFIRATGATGQMITVRAINDYQTKIPISDLTDLGILFVTRMNGKRLSLRQKGPLFVIYPFDQNPELKSELYYGRSIWQVNKITVE